jgi:hypothetical protein
MANESADDESAHKPPPQPRLLPWLSLPSLLARPVERKVHGLVETEQLCIPQALMLAQFRRRQ